MKPKKIAVIIDPARLTKAEGAILFWGDSKKAQALLRSFTRQNNILGSIYLTYFDGESAIFRIDHVLQGEIQEDASDLDELQALIADVFLGDDSTDTLYAFSVDSGFPMFAIDNIPDRGEDVHSALTQAHIGSALIQAQMGAAQTEDIMGGVHGLGYEEEEYEPEPSY